MDLLKGEIERKRKELEETNVLGVSYLERSFLADDSRRKFGKNEMLIGNNGCMTC